jgi:predicted metal-dependent phosphoesterase TrpH
MVPDRQDDDQNRASPTMTPSSPRAVAGAVLLTGVMIGTLASGLPDRPARRAGEYWILAGDFHVHAFPGDGSLAPWALRDEAARAGLDVMAVTNHNHVFTARLAHWVTAFSPGPIVIVGEEITNPDYHMIAMGLTRAVNGSQLAAAAIADVHAQGGVAIAAHPGRTFHGYDDGAAVAQLDGTEAAHPDTRDEDTRRDLAEFLQRARTLNPRVAPIGSSDFHATPAMAVCRTYVFARERSELGVLEAIRNGRTVAADQDGRLVGDPALVRLVEGATPGGRSDKHPGWRRLSITLAWTGMLGVLLGRGAIRPVHAGRSVQF